MSGRAGRSLVVLGVSLLLVVLSSFGGSQPGALLIDHSDVGQGDATLIISPARTTGPQQVSAVSGS
jgi:hypothetical protein